MDKSARKYGFVMVHLEVIKSNKDIFQLYSQLFNKKVIIIESKVYFEAYHHVLKNVKTMQSLQFEQILLKLDT